MMRPLLFWDVKKRWLATAYWRFGTVYRSHPIAVGLIDPRRAERAAVPKTSVTKHQPTLLNISEERSPQLYRSGRLRSRRRDDFIHVILNYWHTNYTSLLLRYFAVLSDRTDNFSCGGR